MPGEQVFECKKCGQCCEGSGGIILSVADLSRLAKFLGQPPALVETAYAEKRNGKLRLKTAQDGFCIFFRQGKGCSVHEGKPDICRAWPWFRGNLEDEASFIMARDFCPGISCEISHATFITEGLRYLDENRLLARPGENCANSLLQPERN